MAEINDTAAAVLGFLQVGPMTGWQLSEVVRLALCDYFNVTRSQIYRELGSLSAAGLVKAQEKGARHKQPYDITPTGREAFRAWLAEPPGPELVRSPFHLKLLFGDQLEAEALTQMVDDYREHTRERLDYYRQLAQVVRGNGAHVLRYGIAIREAALDWLNDLPELKRGRRRRR